MMFSVDVSIEGLLGVRRVLSQVSNKDDGTIEFRIDFYYHYTSSFLILVLVIKNGPEKKE